MPSSDSKGSRQAKFEWTWATPAEVLEAADDEGAVLFEAPEVSRLRRERTPRLPRVKVRASRDPSSLGLPFGVRREEGRATCWSCARDVGEWEVVRVGPGMAACPGCGAKLPFFV